MSLKTSLRWLLNRCARAPFSSKPGPRVHIENLEARALLSADASALLAAGLPPAIPQNINISRMRGNQSEGAIAIDPNDPQRVFALSNLEFGSGLFSATSNDGGVTWSTRIIGDGTDSIIPASCDPSAAFDGYGNLFISYLNASTNSVVVARSTDGGHTFRRFAQFRGDVDQPTVTTGPDSVWVTFQKDRRIAAAGAPVSGLGAIGGFRKLQYAPKSNGGNFGDIAVGPRGQVLVTYLAPISGAGPAKIYVNLDKDGLGSAGFAAPVLVASTNVGGFRSILAQRSAQIDAEPGLAFDRSGNTPTGRVYIVYTSASNTRTNDTNIYLRVSRDNGLHWGRPKPVNDDATPRSQFLPRIAVDQTTGDVGISWYDSRNDNGAGPGSANRSSNDDPQFWGAIGRPNSSGVTLSPNFQISQGASNAARADNNIDFGDYTGLSFHGGVMMPIWADNSNSTGDNPNGTLRELDLYTARIPIQPLA